MTPSQQYSYAVGRRKSSTAIVKLFPRGSGKFAVRQPNGKIQALVDYFGGNVHLLDNAMAPFFAIDKNLHKQFDAEIVISGGWISWQSDAIKLGFSRSLIISNPQHRLTLKPLRMLKRDGRIKERKKPGLKKARKAPTRSKR